MTTSSRVRFASVPWSHIVALRVLLAHHYHRVDVEQVWTIATSSVPDLVRHLGAGWRQLALLLFSGRRMSTDERAKRSEARLLPHGT